MIDDRKTSRALLGTLQVTSVKPVVTFVLMLGLAALGAFVPTYSGMPDSARATFFILLLAAGLWVSEAIPAFAVGLLVIALEIAILGRPGGVFAKEAGDWTMFVQPWASPIIWLFFGGFVLAEAASKTGLDVWFSSRVLKRFGTQPKFVLLGVMSITFCFSMFISNTATAAMMMAVIAPLASRLDANDRFRKALLLGVPFAANIGGMGTVIGSPPNAIAAGQLAETQTLHFLDWMFLGLPPALLLIAGIWAFLIIRYPASTQTLEMKAKKNETTPDRPLWERLLVMGTFFVTVFAWLAEPLHGIPTPVISFIPITVFSVFQILNAVDIRRLPWEVLLLLSGGLSLGVAVSQTGLADWLGAQLSGNHQTPFIMALIIAYACSLLSNFMSNTAAANILIPIGLALAGSMERQFVVPIALAASSAMCLPVSTPPNAIAFSRGDLSSKDFLPGGLLVGIIAPLLSVAWCWWLLS